MLDGRCLDPIVARARARAHRRDARDDVVLRVAGCASATASNEVVRGLIVRDPPRRMLRAARAQRRRQDDDAALLPRPHRSRRRRDRDGRPAGAARRRARRAFASASCRRWTTSIPTSRCARTSSIYGRYFGLDRATARRAHPAAARVRRAREQARRRHPHAVGRHEAAPDARARARQRSRAPDPRRADDGPRSAGAAPDLGRPAPAPVAGQDDPAHDALHGRGGAPRDPPRRHRPRHADRERFAARADRRSTSSRRWSRCTATKRRPGPTSHGRRAREAPRARRRDRVLLRRRTRSRCSPTSRRAPACATCTGRRTSRTCSSSSPAASCATRPADHHDATKLLRPAHLLAALRAGVAAQSPRVAQARLRERARQHRRSAPLHAGARLRASARWSARSAA